MKLKALHILTDQYVLFTLVISLAVALLIHFPESVSLFDRFEGDTLFPGMRFVDVANEVFFTYLSLLVMFWVNTQVFHFNQSAVKISCTKVVFSFGLMWLMSNLLGQTFVFLHQTIHIPAIDAMVHHYLHPLRDFIMSCLVTGSCYIIYLIRRQQQYLVANEQLQAENILNQYEVLKNQLNPHMLFNSLNTLRSLVRENQDRAQEYIQELSRVLRYTLQGNESKVVTLKEEMDFVSAYLFLLKMRFEENLQVEICIDKALEGRFLPPMSIQVLIENAVKHNELSNRHPLAIRITTCSGADEELVVSNRMQPKRTDTAGPGIGLANLSKRYRLLLHRDIQISEDGDFTVRLPLISERL